MMRFLQRLLTGVTSRHAQELAPQKPHSCATYREWLLSHFPAMRSGRIIALSQPRGRAVLRGRNKELWDRAEEERRRCRDWPLKFMQGGRPRLLTKDELRVAALRELHVSKNSFDFGWIDAIEMTGRRDWYEPLPRRKRTKS